MKRLSELHLSKRVVVISRLGKSRNKFLKSVEQGDILSIVHTVGSSPIVYNVLNVTKDDVCLLSKSAFESGIKDFEFGEVENGNGF